MIKVNIKYMNNRTQTHLLIITKYNKNVHFSIIHHFDSLLQIFVKYVTNPTPFIIGADRMI